MYSEQALWRGKRALSSSSTRCPASARAAAIVLPPGPPPTTIASTSCIAARSAPNRRHAKPVMGRDHGVVDAGAVQQILQFISGIGATDREGSVVPGKAVASCDSCGDPGGGIPQAAATKIVKNEADPGQSIHLPQHLNG